MTDSNQTCDSVMLELNDLLMSDIDESTEELESFSYQEEVLISSQQQGLDDIPPSLLSYFETSKSRAAISEKVILEHFEDFSASHEADCLMKLPADFDEEIRKLNIQTTCGTENEENKIGVKYVESEADLTSEMSEYVAEREKRHCEEVQKEEQRRQREANFQEELRKIMEAEKLHQMELELKEKRAQEKLEEELRLQQEIISNLKKRVERERRMIEEEQKRKREEDEATKAKEREKEKRMEEEKRTRQEEKKRVKEEEKRNIAMRLEEDRRQKEEEQRRKEEEGEEERKSEMEKDGRGEEMRRKRDEEERNKEKEEKKLKREEEETKEEDERKFLVEGKKLADGEKQKSGQTIKLMDEPRRMEEDGRKMRDEGERRGERELRKSKQVEMRMKHEEAGEDGEKPQAERKTTDGDLTKEGDGRRKPEAEVQLRAGEENKTYEERRERVKKINITRKEEEQEATEQSERRQMETRRLKDEEMKHKQEIQNRKSDEEEKRKMEHGRKGKNREESQDELRKPSEDGMQKEENETRHVMGRNVEETKVDRQRKPERQERKTNNSEEEQESEKDRMLIIDELRGTKGENNFLKSQNNNTNNSESRTSSSATETAHLSDKNCQASPRKPSCSLPVSLPEHTEQKRLSWMKDCVSWSKLSLKNKRKHKGSARSQRGQRRVAEAGRLPSLCPHTLLQSSRCKSLQEITTVTLEDLPSCSLSTLVQCNQLQSLTLRRCGLKSLEGISQLQELCYVDVRENDISFVDCENMSSLQVLRLANNKLKSIHGLSGAHSLNVLDLSYNSITRIAGLESATKLQKLSVDHNQLISTRGLRDVYTLLHLDCSHNHLANTEGLENSALLHTLDLRSNAPRLSNQVLLRELHLDDNSISSLQGLSACWLPLLQNLSAAHNRITQLPFMADFVSLENLDLRFNCLSELKNVCENLEGCFFLQEISLTGNPFQQEGGWRSTLQKAVPGLRSIDNQQTDSFLSAPAAQKGSMVSDSFLMFCQTQLQQTQDIQQHHSSELRNASSPLDTVKSMCHHLTMSLKLAEDQRFAHEYGDTAMTAERLTAGQTVPENLLDMDIVTVEKCEVVTSSPWTETIVRKTDSDSVHILTSNGENTSISTDKATVSSFHDSELESLAAAVIQRRWRKSRQKCGNVGNPSIKERGGEKEDGEKPESGPLFIYRSSADHDCAATVIQAFWRGFALRRRLACALAAAAVTWPDAGEEDTFEEVDVEEFVFDEPALEKLWTVTLSEDSSPSRHPVSEQLLSPKPPVSSHGHSQSMFPAPFAWSPKQAWEARQHVDSHRSQSPPSTAVLSGLSERSEKILEEWGFTDHRTALLMIKRAQKMKSAKQQQKKHRHPSEHLTMFRTCSYHLGPVGARNRNARRNRCPLKGAVGEVEFGLQQAERIGQMRREQAQQRPLTQPDRMSESEHFLPQINSFTLNGGRVQLVADPAYANRPHATELLAHSRLAAQPDKVNAHRNSSGQAMPPGKEALCPKQVASAPTKKERISFRDNPVQLSGGWGGGKKRDRLHK